MKITKLYVKGMLQAQNSTMPFVSSNISLKTCGVLEYRSIGVLTCPSFSMQSTIFKVNRLYLLSHLIYLSKTLEHWSIGVFTSPSFSMQSTIFKVNRLWLMSHLIYLSKPRSMGVLEYWHVLRFLCKGQYSK